MSERHSRLPKKLVLRWPGYRLWVYEFKSPESSASGSWKSYDISRSIKVKRARPKRTSR